MMMSVLFCCWNESWFLLRVCFEAGFVERV